MTRSERLTAQYISSDVIIRIRMCESNEIADLGVDCVVKTPLCIEIICSNQ